jgi:hypothetical protein
MPSEGNPQRFSAHELRLTAVCSSPIVFGNRTLNKIYPLKCDNGPIWKPILVVNEGIFRNEYPVITQLQYYRHRAVLAQLVIPQTTTIFLIFFKCIFCYYYVIFSSNRECVVIIATCYGMDD